MRAFKLVVATVVAALCSLWPAPAVPVPGYVTSYTFNFPGDPTDPKPLTNLIFYMQYGVPNQPDFSSSINWNPPNPFSVEPGTSYYRDPAVTTYANQSYAVIGSVLDENNVWHILLSLPHDTAAVVAGTGWDSLFPGVSRDGLLDQVLALNGCGKDPDVDDCSAPILALQDFLEKALLNIPDPRGSGSLTGQFGINDAFDILCFDDSVILASGNANAYETTVDYYSTRVAAPLGRTVFLEAVPEPASALLVFAGLGLVAGARKRRRIG